MIVINPIGDNLEVGTRIHWDQETRALYYVDVPQSTIYKYKPSTNIITKAKVGNEPLAFAFPVEGKEGRFIVGLGRKIAIVRWDGVSNTACACNIQIEVERQSHFFGNRFNGAKVDPYGRLWAGTMGCADEKGATIPGRGSLYTITHGVLKRHLTGIGISNGLAFDKELNKMYFVDTLRPEVYQYDYHVEDEEIDGKKVVFKFSHHGIKGLPDGLTIERNGNLWVTVIFGSVILKIDPRTKSLLKKIEMPTTQITSLCFGNDDLDVLYVTTAKIPVDGKVPGEPAGCTFKLENLGSSRGLPGQRYKKRCN